MSDPVTSDTIRHFAGLLELVEAPNVAVRTGYDDFAYEARTWSYTADIPAVTAHKPLILDLTTAATKPAALSTPPPAAWQPVESVLGLGGVAGLAPLFSAPFTLSDLTPGTLGVGSGGAAGVQPIGYGVAFEEGGDDALITITQSNRLDDGDRLIGHVDLHLGEAHSAAAGAALDDLLFTAGRVTPADLVPESPSAGDWLALAQARHAALEGGSAEAAFEHGVWVNGVLHDARPDLTRPNSEAPDDGGPGTQFLTTGGNTATHLAVLGDANEAVGTLVVMGDYYETNAIIQANLLADRDQVLPSGNAGEATGKTGDNGTYNIASFGHEAYDLPRLDGVSSKGLCVDVTLVEGDVVDVKALIQRNWISDNDEAYRTGLEDHSTVLLGGNAQTSAARLLDFGQYDVIIVLGDYHSFNLITQTNIVVDDDIVGSVDPFGVGGGVAGDDAQSGRNHLVNDAAIEKRGEQAFQDVNDSLSDLIARLTAEEVPALEEWSGFAGAATGRLDVLVVKGNYYDINVIHQTNIIVDADVAVQGLAAGGQASLNAGANGANNSATIVDVAAVFDQYLGGERYTDSVLIQAEYVDASQTLMQADTMALVNEAVAFTGLLDDVADVQDAAAIARGAMTHDDMMASVLT
ncbi:MAG TPA: hypothetical protein VGU45_16245 [Microvirga sp.]|jgi:hypothetical protein|nr:hypothetical protein [Microvirga sp.]